MADRPVTQKDVDWATLVKRAAQSRKTTAVASSSSSSPPEAVADEKIPALARQALCCGICKELLCTPIMTDCCHVFCDHCFFAHMETVARTHQHTLCPECRQPVHSVKRLSLIDSVLRHLLPNEYAARVDEMLKIRLERELLPDVQRKVHETLMREEMERQRAEQQANRREATPIGQQAVAASQQLPEMIHPIGGHTHRHRHRVVQRRIEAQHEAVPAAIPPTAYARTELTRGSGGGGEEEEEEEAVEVELLQPLDGTNRTRGGLRAPETPTIAVLKKTIWKSVVTFMRCMCGTVEATNFASMPAYITAVNRYVDPVQEWNTLRDDESMSWSNAMRLVKVAIRCFPNRIIQLRGICVTMALLMLPVISTLVICVIFKRFW